ncbi:hypothetical protein DPX16_3042 [Anabarilius grahami]|uniref:Uncharacterized protein n=1 Tax=Anabarilius grahami TaxID=495550 RepID=A0A3N0XJP6_ANAGA|nr:hypothetical protein DPX16_3042 [Anabarilius grahami]
MKNFGVKLVLVTVLLQLCLSMYEVSAQDPAEGEDGGAAEPSAPQKEKESKVKSFFKAVGKKIKKLTG